MDHLPQRLTPMALACLAAAVATVLIALIAPVPFAVRFLAVSLVVFAVARWQGSEEKTRIARGRVFDTVVLAMLAAGLGYLSFSPALIWLG